MQAAGFARAALALVSGTSLALAAASGISCRREEEKRGPPPPPAASGGAANACASGGGRDTDPVSEPLVPRVLGSFCLDPASEPRTYGAQGKLSMDEVCTTAFDGECEVYKRFGLERVVTLRYVDASGAPSSIEVVLSRFASPDGAYGMFTKRVVADGDPARASVKVLRAGAAGALGSSNAYVWRGAHLVELTYVTEDAKMTPEAMARENERSTAAVARAIGDKLPGDVGLPAAAQALPEAGRLPLGIAYHPKDAPGLPAQGPVAVGYYKDGERRWRAIAMVRTDARAAKETMGRWRAAAGAAAVAGVGDEAVRLVLQEGEGRPKAEYVVARKDARVCGIADEELVMDPGAGGAPDQRAAHLLTRDEKLKKLAEWVAK